MDRPTSTGGLFPALSRHKQARIPAAYPKSMLPSRKHSSAAPPPPPFSCLAQSQQRPSHAYGYGSCPVAASGAHGSLASRGVEVSAPSQPADRFQRLLWHFSPLTIPPQPLYVSICSCSAVTIFLPRICLPNSCSRPIGLFGGNRGPNRTLGRPKFRSLNFQKTDRSR